MATDEQNTGGQPKRGLSDEDFQKLMGLLSAEQARGQVNTLTREERVRRLRLAQAQTQAGEQGEITVKGTDGQTFRFPAGTSEDVMRSALQRHYQAQGDTLTQPQRNAIDSARARPQGDGLTEAQQRAIANARARIAQGGVSVNREATSELGQKLSDMGRGAVDGATFGMRDEMAGVWNAGQGDGAMRMLTGNATDQDYTAYNQGAGQSRERSNAAQGRSPGPYLGGQIAGSAAPAIASGPLGLGRSAIGTAGRGITIGSGEGALHGAGTSNGEDMGRNVGVGAGVGGLVGGFAPLVTGVAGRTVGRPIGAAYRNYVSGKPSQRIAGETLQRAMDRSGKSVDEINDYLRQADALGQPEMVAADAMGNAGQRALSGVARQPGAGREAAVQFLDGRQANAGDRVGSFIADEFDTRGTAQQVENRLRTQRGEAGDINYDAARQGAGPVDVSNVIAKLDQRLAPMRGANIEGDSIDGAFQQVRSRLYTQPGPDGALNASLSDFDRVLGVKKDVQDMQRAASRQGNDNRASELGGIVRELDAALEQASAGYRQANDTFRRQSQAIDAIDEGATAPRPVNRADDNIQRFNAMSPDQQQGFRTGYADTLSGRVEAQREGANKAAPFLTDKSRAEIPAFSAQPRQSGSDSVLQNRLLQRLQNENTMFETRRQAIGGSQTADNMADQADVTDDVSILGNLMAQRYGAAAGQMGQRMATAARGTDENTRALIARALMSRDPQREIQGLLNSNVNAQVKQRIVESLMRQPMREGGMAVAR